MENITKLFLSDNLTGRELETVFGKSKSYIYRHLRKKGLIEIKNSIFYRLFSNIEIADNNCWIWQNSLRNGYGVISINRKNESCHKVSYNIFKGEINNGLFVCHTCDNPKCINPDHLFLGTHSDNMIDAYQKGRINVPDNSQYLKGCDPVNRSISLDKAKQIKKAISKRGSKSLKKIAKEFDVSYQLIRDISCGRSYINI